MLDGDFLTWVPDHPLSLMVVIIAGRLFVAESVGGYLARFCASVEVARRMSEVQTGELLRRPHLDVVVIDFGNAAAVGSLRAAAEVRELRVVALGHSGGKLEVAAATRAGADYLSPDASLADLGRLMAGRAPDSLPLGTRSWLLTRRERQIADLLATGRSNADIAYALTLSTATVKNHVHSVLAKLGARDRVEAAVKWQASAAFSDRDWVDASV